LKNIFFLVNPTVNNYEAYYFIINIDFYDSKC